MACLCFTYLDGPLRNVFPFYPRHHFTSDAEQSITFIPNRRDYDQLEVHSNNTPSICQNVELIDFSPFT